MSSSQPPPSYNDYYNESVPLTGGGDAPPSYDQANHNPPSYDEVFLMQELQSEVNQAREEGMSLKLPFNIFTIFYKSIACGICYLILAVLPISMIVMGMVYLHDCNIQSIIPLFLVVFGFVALLQTFIHLIKMCICQTKKKSGDSRNQKSSKGGDCMETSIMAFLLIWIIIGSYYTFSTLSNWRSADIGNSTSCSHPWSNATQDQLDNCCDAPVIYFTFSVLMLFYGTIFFCSFGYCFCACIIPVLARASADN